MACDRATVEWAAGVDAVADERGAAGDATTSLGTLGGRAARRRCALVPARSLRLTSAWDRLVVQVAGAARYQTP